LFLQYNVAMENVTLGTGVSLILIGLVGFGATGMAHPTALIPAAFGVIIAGAGLVARKGGKAKMHATHAALVVALLALLGTVRGVFKLPSLLAGTAERPAAILAQTATAVICALFLTVAIRSFIAARRARNQAQ
jgi:hypothetical protein